ncbi:MAG TPA: DUF1622 domain-containing protein [Nitrososphaera sp.]
MSTESGIEALEGSSESLEPFIDVIIEYITTGIEAAAAIIIGISVVIAFIGYIRTLFRRQKGEGSKGDVIRFRLAGGLLLALDLVVGADILTTSLDPTAEELIRLSVIVAIRIVLGWSLSKEISGHSEDLLRK